jgi:hypothetical protein
MMKSECMVKVQNWTVVIQMEIPCLLQLEKTYHVFQQNQSDGPTVFFKHEGIVHHVYALEGKIINQCACLQILRGFVYNASYN